IDARLRVIADDRAEKHLIAVNFTPVDRYLDRPVRVLQIARDRVRAQVHPLADVTVSDEPVMLLIRVAVEDRALNLAADLAIRADARACADIRAGLHDAMIAD